MHCRVAANVFPSDSRRQKNAEAELKRRGTNDGKCTKQSERMVTEIRAHMPSDRPFVEEEVRSVALLGHLLLPRARLLLSEAGGTGGGGYNQSCHSSSWGLIAACVCSAVRGLPVAGRVIVRPVAKSQSRVLQGLSATPQHMDKPLYQGAHTTGYPLHSDIHQPAWDVLGQ